MTVEAALSLSSLVLVAAGIVAGLATVSAQITAVDAAGAAARAHAIGVAYTPPRGVAEVAEADGVVTAVVRVPAPLGERQASARFPVERAATR
ncbi:hypothetical protein CUTER_00910 [Corynebacterium uterequi]|uniref:Uncharacterized protein n=1 Tax=Corynebacterium uterequi TaxID=1072256 RepID=A0A0G3HE44_9CORY|nr:hypothetical protein CUTER_00910 [Corynebacterium uterequi]